MITAIVMAAEGYAGMWWLCSRLFYRWLRIAAISFARRDGGRPARMAPLGDVFDTSARLTGRARARARWAALFWPVMLPLWAAQRRSFYAKGKEADL